MENRDNFDVCIKQMGGDASQSFVIEVIVHSQNSGIKYTDNDMIKPYGRKTKSKTGYDFYQIHNIKILMKIW